jgi:hypothetical protein
MAFWILLAASIILLIVIFIHMRKETDDSYSRIGVFSIITALVILIAAMIITVVGAIAPNLKSVDSEERTELRGLTLSSASSSKSFFLGNSYQNETRVINYIAQKEDGKETWNVVSSAPAKSSRIFEDEIEKPYVVKSTYVYDNPWVLPWNFKVDKVQYDFHVPENSVVENYEVEN